MIKLLIFSIIILFQVVTVASGKKTGAYNLNDIKNTTGAQPSFGAANRVSNKNDTKSSVADKSINNAAVNTESIAIFCGTNDKVSDELRQVARILGQKISELNTPLTTSGIKTGLTKEVIDGYCEKRLNGSNQCPTIYGILPKSFKAGNITHPLIPKENFIWTDSFNFDLDQFGNYRNVIVILPGGLGTLHELLEFILQQKIKEESNKRIILLNVDHFWDPLLLQFKNMLKKQTISEKTLKTIEIVSSVDDLMDVLKRVDCYNPTAPAGSPECKNPSSSDTSSQNSK